MINHSTLVIDNLLDELLVVLNEDIQHIQDCLSVLSELRSLVIKRDDAALGKLLSSIRARTDSFAINESKRQSIRKDLADALGCSIGQVTLSALEVRLQGEKKSQLNTIKVKLKALTEELKKEHLRTVLFLSEWARFTRHLLRNIFDLGRKETVLYGPNGETKRQNDRTLVNMRF
jgi:translation initiation factor 1 (eIF-1/SUI1)